MAKNKGFALITSYLVLAVLVAFGAVLAAHALADVQYAQRSQASLQALYLAEAGVDQAIAQLRQNYAWLVGYSSVPLGTTGSYSVSVAQLGNHRRLTAQGSSNLLASPISRSVEAIVRQQIPPNFYDNVIWASQQLDFNGNSYSVAGDVIHADSDPEGTPGNVTGTVTFDPSASPLPRLSFQQLYDMAAAQGNVYDAARIGNGRNVFPTSFWYSPPTDPNDPTTGIPNVNYITTDLILNGNIGTIGGFFVVVGNVLTNPSATEDATINGNGQVAGAIYTTGDFRINGGGNGLNVDGGIWAGDEARLNGNATLTYNWDYMHAIQALGLNAGVQVVSWQDLS